MDTISYVNRPEDMKNDAKKHITQHTHQITKTTKSQIWSQNDLRRLDLGNECIFLHLATTTDTISYVSGPGDAKNDPKSIRKSQVGGVGGARWRVVFCFYCFTLFLRWCYQGWFAELIIANVVGF